MAKFSFQDDRGVAGTGPIAILAGFGVLGLSFILMFLPVSGTAQSVATIQADPVAQAIQLAQRACILSKTDPDYLSVMKATKKLLGRGHA